MAVFYAYFFLLFISTLLPIHANAGPPFRDVRPPLAHKTQWVFNIEKQMNTQ